MGEVEHEPLQGVALVPEPYGDGVVGGLLLMAEGGLFARVADAFLDLGQVDGGDGPPSRGDEAEFIVLFGVLQPHGTATDEHGIALAVDHLELDLGAAMDGLQDDAELADVLLVLKGVAVGVLVVDVVVLSCERGYFWKRR